MRSTLRSPGAARNASAATVASRRDRYLICFCLALITALAWAYLIHLTRHSSSTQNYGRMMADMRMPMNRSWTSVDAFVTFAMWTVMMIGMMTGSAAPMLLLFGGAQATRSRRRVPLSVLLFGVGYIGVWVGFSAIATFAQWALHRAALLSQTVAASNPSMAAAILIVAGIYQLTPFKGACLTQCRSPIGFLMTNWRDGAIGALRMGTRHGLLCLGCCWALMIILFAVGVMNIAWIAALTLLVLIEKLTPAGRIVSGLAGLALIAGGAFLWGSRL